MSSIESNIGTATARGGRGRRIASRALARRRRGSAYLAVVGVALASAAICTGALTVVRAQTRATDAVDDAADARLYALAAIEMGRYIPIKDTNWRTDYGNGAWINNQAFGRGSLKLLATTASGGSIQNAASTDPVLLKATGTCGKAQQKIQATLSVVTTPMDCLQTAMTAAGSISTSMSVTYAASGMTIATNGSFTQTLSSINATVQAVGSCNVSGGTSGATARTVPDSTGVFSFYTDPNNATTIPVTTLSGGSTSSVTVQYKLLTPTQNTFPSSGSGATNSNGIYVIDCLGKTITIEDCRIVGTLVLLNVGTNSKTANNLSWSPAVANYPCLLVSGAMTFSHTSSDLAETSANFNPVGTPPAENGTNNTSVSGGDKYPGGIRGLVYVSGAVKTTGSPLLWMLMAGSTVTSGSGSLTMNYDPTYYNNAPPGFGSLKVQVSPASWQQAAAN